MNELFGNEPVGSEIEPQGEKEKCGWAVLTAFGCMLATELAKILVAEGKKRFDERQAQKRKREEKPGSVKNGERS